MASICEIFPLIAKFTSEGKRVVLVNEGGKRSIFVEDTLVLGYQEHKKYAQEAVSDIPIHLYTLNHD